MSTATSSPAVLSVGKLRLAYGLQVVLDDTTLAVHEGERLAIVGRNGCGKSSLLKILAGAERPDSGDFNRKRDLTVGYLPQTFDLDPGLTVGDNIRAGLRHITDLLAEYENLPPESDRAGDLAHQLTEVEGWDLDHRIESVARQLRTPALDRPAVHLSGGERRRVALCRALLAHPDLLLLDEPTNHLDTESIEWLEDFLLNYHGTCVFITHDRAFLDRVATRVAELARGEIFSHPGNYTDYLIGKAEREASEARQESRRQSFLRREIEWVRRQPAARTTKSRNRLDAFFTVADAAPPEVEGQVDMLFPPPAPLSNEIVDFQHVSLALGGNTLLRDFSLRFQEGWKLGLVGRNGLGKTSLVRMVLGEQSPDHGIVIRGKRVEFNYLDQNRMTLDENKTVMEEVSEDQENVRFGQETLSIRAYLRRFLFTDDRLNQRIDRLSGGERSRVLLAKILKRGGNFLVMDEPTNDLDLNTLRVLEEALRLFPGCVLIVSHDRYFLNRVCSHILAFEGNAHVRLFTGNYADYREKFSPAALAVAHAASAKLTAAAAAPPVPAKLAPPEPSARTAPRRKLTWKEQRELEAMEIIIQTAEAEAERLQSLVDDPAFYVSRPGDITATHAALAEKHQEIQTLYARWEELEALRAAAP